MLYFLCAILTPVCSFLASFSGALSLGCFDCFSAFYSKIGNPFAEEYVALCKEVVSNEVI